MLNAPNSSGGNNRIVYQSPSGVPFARQGQLNYLPQGGAAGGFNLPFTPRFPGGPQDAVAAIRPMPYGWGWPEPLKNASESNVADTFKTDRAAQKGKNAYSPAPSPEASSPDTSSKDTLSRPQSKVAQKSGPDKNPPLKTPASDTHNHKAKTDARMSPAQAEPAKGNSWFNASTLIGAFKVTSALIITGGINAFFFGVPIYIASGLSAVVAGSQSLAALKIHKEDSEFTRKVVRFSRKLMGRQNDPTPAGKEWSMVPVWAAICGSFGLSEAMGNHIYKRFTGHTEKNFDARMEDLKKTLGSDNGWLNVLKPIQEVQQKGMQFVKSTKKRATTLFEKWATQGGVRKMPQQALQYVMKSSGGRNMPLAYLWSFGMASFGGAMQTVLAALMQQKVDKAHGIQK
ncbi:hypothetical protein [Vampirovibrio sp.]|uniref:hypothetical protein n=1 Tax=Vampirovibrio sp. TaxID=2717857 RepID=UPI0035932753